MIEGTCHCAAVRWRFESRPDQATACNCTVCRRYGVLWAYDFEGEGIVVAGATREYLRSDGDGHLGFHFCPVCGCVTFWRGRRAHEQKRLRIAVNLRLADPGEVAGIPIRHFDGLQTYEDLPPDGKCVGDYWF